MKKILITMIFMFTVTLFFAHPPSDIKLTYDAATKTVSINVIHQIAASKVTDPAKHYVKDITVTVNDKAVITESLTSQQSDDGVISTFLLKANPNDKISVTAACSLSGVKTMDLVVK